MIKLFIYKARKAPIFNVFVHAKYNFVWKNAQIYHEKSAKNVKNSNWECKKIDLLSVPKRRSSTLQLL